MDRRRPEAADVRERIHAFLKRSPLRGGESPRVVPLTGDASTRRYFRVLPADGAPFVLALHEEPFAYDELPFVNIAELLRRVPVPIPRILDHAGDLGILALEDLGDVTLQAHLGAAPRGEHTALYREAVELIATWQRRGRDLSSPRYLAYRISFDVERLTWELNFFVRHFLEAYRGLLLTPDTIAALAEEWRGIAEALAAEPQVLCHRDYHSRNLMWHADRLYIIDFQDARLGPDTYDLASLLRDSYVEISEECVSSLIDEFLRLKDDGERAADFRRRFDLMAVQRNLKALGTFGYQTATRGNPVYVQYIPRTLHYLQTNLSRNPRFSRLHGLLAELVDELD